MGFIRNMSGYLARRRQLGLISVFVILGFLSMIYLAGQAPWVAGVVAGIIGVICISLILVRRVQTDHLLRWGIVLIVVLLLLRVVLRLIGIIRDG
jgi:hypothetical protein